jgi:hypothetical protein
MKKCHQIKDIDGRDFRPGHDESWPIGINRGRPGQVRQTKTRPIN